MSLLPSMKIYVRIASWSDHDHRTGQFVRPEFVISIAHVGEQSEALLSTVLDEAGVVRTFSRISISGMMHWKEACS